MNSIDTSMRTTVNVRADWYERICEYAEKSGTRTSDVLRILLEKQIGSMSKAVRSYDRTMKYQARGFSYKPMHVRMSCFEYSRFRDVMLCFRFCLSYILALAMERFDEFMSTTKTQDSYPGEAYTKIVTVINNMNIFINMWGIPAEQHTLTIPPG